MYQQAVLLSLKLSNLRPSFTTYKSTPPPCLRGGVLLYVKYRFLFAIKRRGTLPFTYHYDINPRRILCVPQYNPFRPVPLPQAAVGFGYN